MREVQHILFRASRRIIREKRAPDAERLEPVEKWLREWEDASTKVERAVQIEREMTDLAKLFCGLTRHIKTKAPRRDPWGFLFISSPNAHLNEGLISLATNTMYDARTPV